MHPTVATMALDVPTPYPSRKMLMYPIRWLNSRENSSNGYPALPKPGNPRLLPSYRISITEWLFCSCNALPCLPRGAWHSPARGGNTQPHCAQTSAPGMAPTAQLSGSQESLRR